MLAKLIVAGAIFCVGILVPVRVARFIDRKGWELPLPLWFLLVSMVLPAIWLALQAIAVVPMLASPQLHARVAQNLPLFLRTIVIPYTLRLWAVGALTAGVLGWSRRRSFNEAAKAEFALMNVGGIVAIALIAWALLPA